MQETNNKLTLTLVAINKNQQIKRLRSYGDRLADRVTAIAGSTLFLTLNIIWFASWIMINTGAFGEHLIFDEYPFGFLTMVVSLEAIILAVFVLISQNRQSKKAEMKSELEYVTDLQSDVEVTTIMRILERISEKQDLDISDLLVNLEKEQKRILKEHPISEEEA